MVAYVIGADSTCRKYDCSTTIANTTAVIGRTCGFYNTSMSTYLVQTCGRYDLACPLTLAVETNSTCVNHTVAPNQFLLNFVPGEVCTGNNQCRTGINCNSGVCVGAAENATCVDSFSCNAGLHCKASVCVPVKQSGETCDRTKGDVCAFGNDCFRGKCKRFGTVVNEQALETGASMYLCHSFYAAKGTNGSNFCVNPPALIGENFNRSDPNDIMCNYTAYQPGTGDRIDGRLEPAHCGFNMINSHYCPRYKGEFSFADQAQEYRSMWSENNFTCHVNSNHIYCKDVIDKGFRRSMAAWIVDEFETILPESYSLIANNAQCIRETATAAYWHAKNLYSATIFGVLGMIISAFYFIY
jgi:hypothetical protein